LKTANDFIPLMIVFACARAGKSGRFRRGCAAFFVTAPSRFADREQGQEQSKNKAKLSLCANILLDQ
jgi:hypothetical protein